MQPMRTRLDYGTIIEKKKERKMFLLAGSILIILFIFSLCFRTATSGFIPEKTLSNLWEAAKLLYYKISGNSGYLNKNEVISALPYYYETIARLKNSIITVLAGMAVALSGSIFQAVFKNPLASPNILGVSGGVNLGNTFVLVQFSAMALMMPLQRYAYCYGFAIAVLILVLLVGKLAGGKRFSVMDTILIGTVVSQVCNIIILYYQFNMDEELLAVYQQLIMGTYIALDNLSLLIFVAVVVIGSLPILLIRFRFNILCFDEEESRAMGINPKFMRLTGLVCATVIITAALIHCGSVGMLALIVPHIGRYFVGADFGKLSLASMFMGGIILLISRIVSSMIYVAGYPLPVNFIISVLAAPVFIVVLIKQRRGFE